MMDDWLNPITGIYDEDVLKEYGDNKPLLGIAGRLKELAPNCEIYAENNVLQDLIEPCFFIQDIDYSESKISGTHYEFECTYNIHFFPVNDGKVYNTLRKMMPAVIDAVEYINVLDPVTMNTFIMTGRNRRAEIVDYVLHVFVTYDMRFYKPLPPDPLMETLTEQQKIETE